METLSPEQEEVLTKYCDEIFASGAETEEFFYRLGIKDGLRLKSTIKSVLEMMEKWTTASDGKTYQVEHYNLDRIISVEYRVKFNRWVEFCKWASKVLK